ncbi:MAG: DUF3943 domain-containing protein [Deltaproteobacteria bacterium]|nr:DUF3943 domain-containing protein [Deltaproteobacteria bacterium]
MQRFLTLLVVLAAAPVAADVSGSKAAAGDTSAGDGDAGAELTVAVDPDEATPAIDSSTIGEEAPRPRRTDPTSLGRKLKIPIVVLENLMVIVPPAIYYWNSVDDQKEDWELGWSWSVWKSKLTTTRPLVLDTNRFEANGMRHPLAGALTYQIGRANGFGVFGSTMMNFAASWVWEYIGEFRERPAVNDLITNTASGILIGEPLFQIGKLGDGQGGLTRRGLAMVASPFSRVQKELGLSPLANETAPAHRIQAFAGTSLVRHDGERAQGEFRLGLDLEIMRDYSFARPGRGVTWTKMAGWNRMAFDLRIADQATEIPGYRFRSSTTYVGRYARDLDINGYGNATFLGVGGGFHLHQRRLAAEIDRYSVLSMVSPRAGGWLKSPQGELDWEVAVSGDLAMVQAHAFGLEPLMEDSSILRTRGYYYAPGTSATARLRARSGRWNAELEGAVHQFWSFDDHSYGGEDDPKNVQDQRAVSTATIGMRPTSADIRVELFADAILRRGTWTTVDRRTTEVAGGVALTAGF